MIAGDAPVSSVPVSDALHVTPAAAGLVVNPLSGIGGAAAQPLVSD